MAVVWIESITDRTQADVDRVLELNAKIEAKTATPAEIAEYATDLKGALNRSDLERICNNINILIDTLQLQLTPLVVPELPKVSFYQSIVTYTQAIRNAYMVHTDTPQTPAMPLNSFSKINDIEHILQDVYNIIISNFHYYCGAGLYAGCSIGLLE
jgi:hypothetical protein